MSADSLSRAERAIARQMFQLRVHRSNGQAYEDLFVQIMSYKNSNFRAIEAYGNVGDRKNDGYDPSTGTYYQIFAPKDITKTYTRKDAVDKAKRDFLGLKAYWDKKCKISNYYFVVNDKFNGSIVDIEDRLMEIHSDHSLDKCSVFLAKDLENLVFKLQVDEIISVLGSIPNPDDINQLDFSIAADIIRHIVSTQKPINPLTSFSSPTLDEKIKFNGLEKTKSLLENGARQTGEVIDYFRSNSDISREDVRDNLNQIYQEAKLKDYPGDNTRGDYVFYDILTSMTGRNPSKSVQDAALVIMAYFFESYDIFEPPVEANR